MRTAAKIDANQNKIVDRLRKTTGCKVQVLSMVGGGCPDILVGFMGKNYLFEIKNPEMPPSKRRLTKDEKRFHNQWSGQVDTVLTVEDCWEIMGIEVEYSAPF